MLRVRNSGSLVLCPVSPPDLQISSKVGSDIYVLYFGVCVFNALFSSKYQLFSELFWGIRWYKIIGSNLFQHSYCCVCL